jgi:hypothetical protein
MYTMDYGGNLTWKVNVQMYNKCMKKVLCIDMLYKSEYNSIQDIGGGGILRIIFWVSHFFLIF